MNEGCEVGQRRRLKKQQQTATQPSAARQPASQKRLNLLGLQENAGNRAVSDLLGSLSGVPAPMVTRTPIGVSATVYFAKNSALLDAANFQAVEELAKELGFLAEPLVTVDGHASSEGQEPQNLALSKQRKQTVTMLLTRHVKRALDVKGEPLGETQPAVPEAAEDEQTLEQQRAQNRRVEITIIHSQQKPSATAEPERKIDLRLPPSRLDEPPGGPFDFKLPPPIKRPKISIAGGFDKAFNQVTDSLLDELNIKKPWMRSLLKKGARAAIDKGLESALDEAMDQADLRGETREAFKKGLEAGLKLEF
jgi:outer membrane protein OmpA-like peptidoglycan-associated protein